MSRKKQAPEERSYKAFISYRHKPLDKAAAERIQRSIERYTVPKELRGSVGGRKKLGKVFRDEDELPASSSLSGSITYALDHSEYLLVICTPDLPESKWCEQEIRYFLQTHDRDHVVAVLADGEPEQSFSPLLLHSFDAEGNLTGDTEPLAANIAGREHSIDRRAYRKEIVRVFAALLGCPFDTLWNRERRARTRRVSAALTAALLIMAAFLVVVLNRNAEILRRNEQITQQNEQITRQNGQITEQNEQITQQNAALQLRLSASLVDGGLTMLEDYDVSGALDKALSALEGMDAGNYDRRAQLLLSRALGAYTVKQERSSLLFRQETAIESMVLTADGSRLLLSDSIGAVRCVDAVSGALLWETAENSSLSGSAVGMELLLPEGRDVVLCKTGRFVSARALSDGRELWRYSYFCSLGNSFCQCSPDGETLLLLDEQSDSDDAVVLRVLDIPAGRIRCSVKLGQESERVEVNHLSKRWQWAAAFEDGGASCTLAYYVERDTEDGQTEQRLNFTQYDCSDWSPRWTLFSTEAASGSVLLYGLAYLSDGRLVCARYHPGFGAVVVTSIAADGSSGEQEKFNHMLDTDNPIDWYASGHFVPMLSAEPLLVVCSGGTLFILDLQDGIKLRKSYGFRGDFLAARWVDRAEERVELFTDYGVYMQFDLSHEGSTAMEGFSAQEYDQTGISLLCPAPLDAKDGTRLWTVRSERPGQVLALRSISDPDAEQLPGQLSGKVYSAVLRSSPSGEKLFAFYNDSELTVVCYDAQTLRELGRASFEGYFYKCDPVMLDESRFLLGSDCFGMDGSVVPLADAAGEAVFSSHSTGVSSVRTSDGRVLSCSDDARYVPDTLFQRIDALWVWVDGACDSASDDPACALLLRDAVAAEPGANGWVVGCGLCGDTDAQGEPVFSEEVGFSAVQPLAKRRVLLENPAPEEKLQTLLPGTEQPIFACLYESGRIFLFDIESGSARELPASYVRGELLGCCFAEGDGQLLALTAQGRLDVWDAADGTLLFSDVPELFAKNLDMLKEPSCLRGADGRLQILSRNYWVCMDPESWTVTDEAESIVPVQGAGAWLYTLRQGSLLRFPLRSVEELAAWARALS